MDASWCLLNHRTAFEPPRQSLLQNHQSDWSGWSQRTDCESASVLSFVQFARNHKAMEIKRVSSAMHPGEAVTAGSFARTSEVEGKNPGAFRSGQITQKKKLFSSALNPKATRPFPPLFIQTNCSCCYRNITFLSCRGIKCKTPPLSGWMFNDNSISTYPFSIPIYSRSRKLEPISHAMGKEPGSLERWTVLHGAPKINYPKNNWK